MSLLFWIKAMTCSKLIPRSRISQAFFSGSKAKSHSSISNCYDNVCLLSTTVESACPGDDSGDLGTALDAIDRSGFLGPLLTLGHGVWLNEADLDRIAGTGTHICHNCSSNFRLRSGVAPLNAFEERGIDTAIGLDEAGINDDRDLLQEMRMVLRAHRVPGMEDADVPSPGQVLRRATAGGAATTPFGTHIGTLAVGEAADLVLIDWDKLAYPYLDPETPILDAILQRAKTDGVDLVMVGGEVVYGGGRFTRVDRAAALRELHASLQHALSEHAAERLV